MNKVFGATLLVAGCSIGVGMLGLPSVTGAAGFFPSSIVFFLSWAFMVLTGLVLAEVTLSFKTPGISFVSMTEKTLGRPGKFVTWILFSLLFYTILVAYFIGGGIFVIDFCRFVFGTDLSMPVATLLLGCVLLGIMYKGIRSVDRVNQLLMLFLFLFYSMLIGTGIGHIEMSRIARTNWEEALFAIPVLVICFGFHNLVPALVTYLGQKERPVKKALLFGSLIPLALYLLWEFVILGVVPFSGKEEWKQVQEKGEMITQILANGTLLDEVVFFARGFSFFAIATSFLPVAFSFSDFLRDACSLQETKKNRFVLGLCVLLPPLVVALTRPDSFLIALEYAGGFCTVLLFGLLPVCMAVRRMKGDKTHFKVARPFVLGALVVAVCTIFVITLIHRWTVS